VYYGLVALADAKFLGWEVSKDLKREENGHTKRLSDLSSYGPLSNTSGLSCSLLMNMPFEFFGVKICKNGDQFRQDIL
jgi:hypothetical protein